MTEDGKTLKCTSIKTAVTKTSVPGLSFYAVQLTAHSFLRMYHVLVPQKMYYFKDVTSN